LRLLARTRHRDTAAFLDRIDVGAGWRCLDLGCGSGDVTFELARRAGPGGHVDGIDIDDAQLRLVRAAAREAKIENVEFSSLDILGWTPEPTYDLVYSRFVLQHLAEPVTALSRMLAALRPGGVLAVEDADFLAVFAYPPDEGFDFYAEMYRAVLTVNGGDPVIGRKLFGYFQQMGVADVKLDVRQGVHVGSDEAKLLELLTLRTTAQSIVDAGLASWSAVDRAIELLGQYAARPDSMLSGPRIFQVWGHRTIDSAT
jgi:SAM-dependent methyltransferase